METYCFFLLFGTDTNPNFRIFVRQNRCRVNFAIQKLNYYDYAALIGFPLLKSVRNTTSSSPYTTKMVVHMHRNICVYSLHAPWILLRIFSVPDNNTSKPKVGVGWLLQQSLVVKNPVLFAMSSQSCKIRWSVPEDTSVSSVSRYIIETSSALVPIL